MVAFPGISKIFRRNMEFSYCKTMGNEALRSITDFKHCLEMFLV